jgi:hypothetical protein
MADRDFLVQHANPDKRPVDAVGILPWLDVQEPITIGSVVIYPAAEAIALLGAQGDVLQTCLSRYASAWSPAAVRSSVAIDLRQLSDHIPVPMDDITRAVDILFAAAAYTDPLQGFHTNSTTFQLFFQFLGGNDAAAYRVRRRNGFMLSGGRQVTISKPLYCGTYLHHSYTLREALVAAIDAPDQGDLFKSLAWFRRASSDADNIDREVDRVLLRTAVDWLVAHAGTHANGGLDQDRIAALLSGFPTIVLDKHDGKDRSAIQCALHVLNLDRHGTLHPVARTPVRKPYAFERPRLLLDWVADRCNLALLVARLVELGTLPDAEESRAFIRAVEKWLHDPSEDDFSRVLPAARLDAAVDLEFFEMMGRIMNDVDRDLRQPEWEVKFYDALEAPERVVDDLWEVNVFWRRDGRGPVAQILERLPRSVCVRDIIDFAPDEDAETAAAVVREWCNIGGRPVMPLLAAN